MTANVQRFDTGEVELAYSEWPGESPPIVMIHGGTGSRQNWVPRLDLRGNQRAYAFDMRGHGDSGRTPGSYRFVDFGRDAVRFLEGVVQERSILIGHSGGAMACVYAAAECPDLCMAAILVDPPLSMAAFEGSELQQQVKPIFGPFLSVAGKPVGEILAAGYPEGRASNLARLDADVIREIVDGSFGLEGWDQAGLLRRIECPVLLEYGEQTPGGVGFENSVMTDRDVEAAKSLIGDCTRLYC